MAIKEENITDDIYETAKLSINFSKVKTGMPSNVKTKDIKAIAKADVAIHDIIAVATGNQRLIQLINNLAEQMYRYRFEYIKDMTQHERIIEEHRIIYESIIKKDKEAAAEIAHQLRLRNMSGIIIVDFINMKQKESIAALLSLLDSELKKDPVRTVLVDITRLSLVEITRMKKEKPLHEAVKNS